MNRAWKTVLWILVAVVLSLAALVAAALVWVLPQVVGSVTVDGQTIELTQAHAGHWLLATAGVLIALMAVLLVAPLALIVGLALPMVALVLGVLIVAAALTLVLSPLWLIGWLIWRASRRSAADTVTIPPP